MTFEAIIQKCKDESIIPEDLRVLLIDVKSIDDIIEEVGFPMITTDIQMKEEEK